jgi:hypothetical protein
MTMMLKNDVKSFLLLSFSSLLSIFMILNHFVFFHSFFLFFCQSIWCQISLSSFILFFFVYLYDFESFHLLPSLLYCLPIWFWIIHVFFHSFILFLIVYLYDVKPFLSLHFFSIIYKHCRDHLHWLTLKAKKKHLIYFIELPKHDISSWI